MPKVPTYDAFQATPNVLPNARVTAPDMPDVAGQQAQQLSQGLMRAGDAALRIQDEANKVRVDDALNQLTRARTDMQVRAMQLRGRNALERPGDKSLPDEFGAEFDKAATEVAANLGNDAQRALFAAHAGKQRSQLYTSLSSHMIEQQRAFQKETYASTIEIAQNNAALLWGDPAERQNSVAAIQQGVIEMARLSGWDDKTREVEYIKQMSPMHVGIVKGMLTAGKGAEAQQYVTENTATMTLQARAMVQDMVKTAGSLERAQTFADEVMRQGVKLEDALSQAREKFSGDDEVRAVAEIKQRFSEGEAALALGAKTVSRDAWSIIMEKGSMSAVPPDTMALLRKTAPEEERQMRDWLDAKWRRAKADAEGKRLEDGFDTYYGLRRLAMDDPQRFVALDLRKSAPYLTKGMLETLTNLQGSIDKNESKAMESQRVLKNTLATIRADVAAIGIDLTPKEGTPQAKETAKFLGALSVALDDATRAKGSPLTNEEAKRIGTDMLREGIEQGSGVFGMFQTKRRGYQIATNPDVKPGASYVVAPFGKIPEAVRSQLVTDYRVKNNLGTRALTSAQEAEIERMYTRGVQTGRFQ